LSKRPQRFPVFPEDFALPRERVRVNRNATTSQFMQKATSVDPVWSVYWADLKMLFLKAFSMIDPRPSPAGYRKDFGLGAKVHARLAPKTSAQRKPPAETSVNRSSQMSSFFTSAEFLDPRG